MTSSAGSATKQLCSLPLPAGTRSAFVGPRARRKGNGASSRGDGVAALSTVRAGSSAWEAARRRNSFHLVLRSQSPCLESFARRTVQIQQDGRRCPRLHGPGPLELWESIAG